MTEVCGLMFYPLMIHELFSESRDSEKTRVALRSGVDAFRGAGPPRPCTPEGASPLNPFSRFLVTLL